MNKAAKVFAAARRDPKSLTFAELKMLVLAAGFSLKRTSGSHHVFSKPGVIEIINLQPIGKAAKPYQVRQVLSLIQKYNIEIE